MKICAANGCDRKANRSSGYCSMHHKRYVRHGDANYQRVILKYCTCRVDGCENLVGDSGKRGMCSRHYKRFMYALNKKDKPHIERKKSTGHPFYNIWLCMRDRCRNPKNKSFKNYGGRGISVCERWSNTGGFWNFVEDMGERPKGYSIDRIDVDGNYEPSNCRWACRHMQNINKRNNKEYHNIRFDNRHKETLYVVLFEKATSGGKKAIIARKSFHSLNDAIRYRDMKEKELYDTV